ncbi:DNA ligase [Blautia sp.]|uniref:DNA ligase n=1 Tax=Blautia sp. TaxID=1955243 RepID=UPI0026142A2A|nr:DNA ligase [Blautia sp.]
MSKMAEMAQTIEDLRTAAASINAAADWLYQQFSGDVDEAKVTEAPAKKKPKPELKLEDVRAVLAEKSRAGHTAEVRALLKKFGAAKLSEIDPANYEALMKDAEVIGNGN